MRSTLSRMYGIDTSSALNVSTVEGLYDKAVELCERLPVTVESFWTYGNKRVYSDIKKGIKYHIITEELLYFKEFSTPDYTSIATFAEDYRDRSNFAKSFTDFQKSCFFDFFKISQTKHTIKSSFVIPGALKFLIRHSVATIRQNPYAPCIKTRSIKRLMNFIAQFHKTVKIETTQDATGFLNRYYTLRLLDTEILETIAKRIYETKFELSQANIVNSFSHIVKVPAVFSKTALFDLYFEIHDKGRKLERAISTKLDDWNASRRGTLAYIPALQSEIMIEEASLSKWIAYINFISSTYIPILKACFHILFCDCHCSISSPSSNTIAALTDILMKYISTEKIDDGVNRLIGTYATKLYMDKKCEAILNDLYTAAYNVFYKPDIYETWHSASQLNYFDNYAQYLDNLIETVIQAKAEMHL